MKGSRRIAAIPWGLQILWLSLFVAGPFGMRAAETAIVINEIHYHPGTDEELEEFIELHNTGGTAVDVSNWQFVQGVTYTFPAGASVPAQGYLVVARDQAHLASLFGGLNLVGNVVGRLDNNGERLTLVDDAGTTIDTLRYDDKWPWPAAADGTGSSLELVNPNDDNDHPRNWRGSMAGVAGTELFQHEALVFSKRYTPTGSDNRDFRISGVPISVDPARTLESVELPAPPSGKVFLFGLTLFDGVSYTYVDLSSYMDSDGFSFDTMPRDGNLDGGGNCYPAEELPSLGGLTACEALGHGHVKWRTPDTTDGANNCVRWSGEVITVPAGPYVKAYFLATATNTSTINMQVILNYSDGGDAEAFEITDWFSGISLPTHVTSRVTPGSQNSAYATNTPPFIHEIGHLPQNPASSQAVTVTARVDDFDGIADVTLTYSVNEGTEQTVTMFDDGLHGDGPAADGVYGVVLPAQPSESVVAYWINARDGAGTTERFPYTAEPEQALAYFVYDGEVSTNLPIEWLFISPGDKAQLDGNPSSDETVPATFVDHNGRVYYHIQVRYRGAWARAWPKKCWKLIFNKGNEFGGRGRINLNSNWNDEILIREFLCYEIFRMAGYPYCESRLIHFRTGVGAPSTFQGVYVEVEQPNRDFLERNDLDRDGSLYKAVDNGVYPPRSNERKLSPQSLYYTVYEKKTLEWEDYTDLITWIEGLDAAPPTSTVDYLTSSMDHWRLTEYMALNAIISNWDHVGKNHYDFRDSQTNQWIQLPWDLDRSLGEYTSPNYRTDQPLDYGREEVAGPGGMYSYLHDRYLEAPPFLAFYYRMLRKLCCDVFNEPRMHAVVDRIRLHVGGDAQLDYNLWKGGASYNTQWTFWRTTRDYIRERRDFILSNLPAEGDVVINEFMSSNTVTRQDEAGDYDDWVELYNPKSTAVNLSGYYLSDHLSSPTLWRIPDGTSIAGHGRLLIWCDGETTEGSLHASFRLDDDGEEIGLFDIDANGNLPIDWLTYGPQVADVSAGRNGDGTCGWVAYSPANPTDPNPSVAVGTPPVRINEWMALNHTTHADEKGEYDDWVELYNDSDEPVCIGGRFLTDGRDKHDSWMIPLATIIAPRGFLVVWCDSDPNDGPVHTNYGLDAAGEEIALYDWNTATLIDSVVFGLQQADISEGRCPDGSDTITVLNRPSPGGPNCLQGPSAVSSWKSY